MHLAINTFVQMNARQHLRNPWRLLQSLQACSLYALSVKMNMCIECDLRSITSDLSDWKRQMAHLKENTFI